MNIHTYKRYVVSEKHGFYMGERLDAVEIPGKVILWDMLYVGRKWSAGYLTFRGARYWSEYFSCGALTKTKYNICLKIWNGGDACEVRDLCTKIEPYWWCRVGHWRPYWGILTQMRVKLIENLGDYFVKVRKRIILEHTSLPLVLIDIILDMAGFICVGVDFVVEN